ncbi:hypothetical protein Taro_008260 [Colocasia esculenta]|uniref:TOD1/MUCI70 glycosyltransferase-like domain-containing protein n=1 Tax=Colocasia esculenta TaxID=4460 RepID=A0A843U1C5_COLES|nr:hypothetical protein [Colocasia esculenta]
MGDGSRFSLRIVRGGRWEPCKPSRSTKAALNAALPGRHAGRREGDDAHAGEERRRLRLPMRRRAEEDAHAGKQGVLSEGEVGGECDVGMAQLRQSGQYAGGSGESARIPHRQGGGRVRRPGHKSGGFPRVSIFAVTVSIAVGLLVSLSVFHYLFHDGEVQGRWDNEREQDNDTNGAANKETRPRLERSMAFKKLRFGKGSVVVGRDSRYWDKDDRRRDEDYNEDSSKLSNVGGGSGSDDHMAKDDGRRTKVEQSVSSNGGAGDSYQKKSRRRGLYNEAGRTELKEYEEKYEESLKKPGKSAQEGSHAEEVNSSDEYDDGFDIEEASLDASDDLEHNDKGHLHEMVDQANDGDGGSGQILSSSEEVNGTPKGCEIKFLNSTDLLVEPLEKKKFSRFSLRYKEVEDRPGGVEEWEPRFAGHQSLQEREESFYARDKKINCGFVKGPKGSPSTGFDLAEDDVKFMSSCHIAVSSCIFGNSDRLKTPSINMIKRSSRKAVCYVMFVDEITLQTFSAEGQKPDRMGFVGLWKIVVVRNLPYTDMRRVGKIPKFLTHRLFPSARYSIWLDSKLRLTSDPQRILEYFLWRKGYEYAISNHYDRHCVWEEVVQNKKLNKFNHTIIDEQFAFYQADGLKRFDPSDPNKLLPSYVPEGSFIMRAHTPMSNLFSCLWFNEVDLFTPRDQLSFAYTYLKLRRTNPEKPFYLNMFKDCERRAIAKLYRHRSQSKWTTVQTVK